MSEADLKPLWAAVFMSILFLGVWVFAHKMGYVEFDKPALAYRFLGLTTLLWIGQVFLSSMSGHHFQFSDHGFELCCIALVEILTLLAQGEIENSRVPDVGYALVVVLVLVLGTLYINTRRPAKGSLLPAHWRFVSYVLGTIAAEIYILVSLSPHIKTWTRLFS